MTEKHEKMLSEGHYSPARAVQWKLIETQGGAEQLAVEFEFKAGDAIMRRTWYGSFTDASWQFTLKACRAMGWNGVDPAELDMPEAGLNALEVSLEIKHEYYKDKWREKIAWVNPLGGIAVSNPLSLDKKQALSQRLKGLFISADAGQPPKKAKNGATGAQAGRSGNPSLDQPEPPPIDLENAPF